MDEKVQDSDQPLMEFLRAHHPEIDEAYHQLVAQHGLYGQAYFGHRRTTAQKRQLRHLWTTANRLVLKAYHQEALEIDNDARGNDG